jgi:Domain of unknown function (DUF4262)
MHYDEDVGEYLDQVESTIEQWGWAVQSVGVFKGEDRPRWSYTVGHEDNDRTELIIVGIPSNTSTGLLNDISDRALASGRWPEHGDVIEDLLVGDYEMRVIAVDEDVAQAGEWFNVALARRGDRSGFKALQIVWPDFDNTWLDSHDERQQLLGKAWWLEQSDAA